MTDSIAVTINVTDVNESINTAPVFTDGESITISVAENTASGTDIGSAITATDADNDSLTYTLGGTDASSFAIDSTTGQLQTSAELDYETNTSYTVTVTVSDGNSGSDSITVTINVTDVEEVAVEPIVISDIDCVVINRIVNTFHFRISGSVTANQTVIINGISGYINDDVIGEDIKILTDHVFVGLELINGKKLEKGESYNFNITGFWTHDGSDNVGCSVNVTYQTLVEAAAPTVPLKTTLLPNYPNPFNPETWIPYLLSKPAEVTLTIYNSRGEVVRELKLGHQTAGVYTGRSRAIHWDGRNKLREKVAAGVYFFTLKAGNFTATRKMMILK